MAMWIGARRGPELTSADFVGLGERLGIPAAAVRRALQNLADRTDLWLADLDQPPFDRDKIGKLRRVICHRRDQLRR